ncbi:hypothetical protein N8813_00180 [bacterium]|nr:hypothetical protein [bacterium]
MNSLLSILPAQLGLIGGPELIVIFLVLVLLIGVPVAIVFIVLAVVKKNQKNAAAKEESDQTNPQD